MIEYAKNLFTNKLRSTDYETIANQILNTKKFTSIINQFNVSYIKNRNTVVFDFDVRLFGPITVSFKDKKEIPKLLLKQHLEKALQKTLDLSAYQNKTTKNEQNDFKEQVGADIYKLLIEKVDLNDPVKGIKNLNSERMEQIIQQACQNTFNSSIDRESRNKILTHGYFYKAFLTFFPQKKHCKYDNIVHIIYKYYNFSSNSNIESNDKNTATKLLNH